MNVFISSTCYDLNDLRSEVENFLKSKGHNPMLSNRENFPVDPGKHRHDVCLENVSVCELFILIVSRRLGAEYYADKSISITWAEFRKAIAEKKKVLAFVRNTTWFERQSYNKNIAAGNKYLASYVDDNRVFDFINEVQKDESGVWLQPFEDSVGIKVLLSNLVETNHSILNPSGSKPAQILNSKYLTPSIFSGATASYITRTLNVEEATQINEEQLQKAASFIPDHPINHIILGFESIPQSNAYTLFQPMRPMGDEGEMLIRIVPTALGDSVKKEILDILNQHKK